MPIRRMLGAPGSPGRDTRRVPVRNRVAQVSKGGKGLEPCVYEDCTFGDVTLQPEMGIIRFTPGFVKRTRRINIFNPALQFADGKRHKFAHYECCHDAGIRMEALSMERCNLGCEGDYACFRNADDVDQEGLYKPVDKPEWGCEPSGCILLEHGWFETRKGGLIQLFRPQKSVAVHWACAKAVWQWELLTGMTDSFNGKLHART